MVEYEIQKLKSVKTQFVLNIGFSVNRDVEKREMDHYFRPRDPAIFNKNNVATVSKVLRRSIDEFKGEIELPKEGENKVRFKNHHKQMKAPFVVYAFESLIKNPRLQQKRSCNAQNRGPRALLVLVYYCEK